MALPATMRRFEISLSDSDRGIYDSLDLRVAQHPSESERYLVARVIARCLEHAPDDDANLEFSKGGVSDDSEPALIRRDLTGRTIGWIEIGSPAADRLHKATKACERVAIYTWRDPARLVGEIALRGVHKADAIELFALDPDLLDGVVSTLDRVNKWDLAISGGTLYLAIGDVALEGTVRRMPITSP